MQNCYEHANEKLFIILYFYTKLRTFMNDIFYFKIFGMVFFVKLCFYWHLWTIFFEKKEMYQATSLLFRATRYSCSAEINFF